LDGSTLNAVTDGLKKEASAPTTSTFVAVSLTLPLFVTFRVLYTDVYTLELPISKELGVDMSATPDGRVMVTPADRLADTFPAASLAQAYSVLVPADAKE
jgi:hypothetical protein